MVMRILAPTVYLLASRRHGTLYLGVTSDLPRRVWQHRHGETPGFTSRYHVHQLVWFEHHERMEAAILRETQVKRWRRAWKVRLIEAGNPMWADLSEVLDGEGGGGFPPSRE